MLNAGDPLALRMADLCDGEVILFDPSRELPAIVEHRAKGGRALFMRDNRIMLATGSVEGPIAEPPAFSAQDGEDDGGANRTGSLLAATAAAVALGIPVEMIRVGIETFEQDRNFKRTARSRPRKIANQ